MKSQSNSDVCDLGSLAPDVDALAGRCKLALLSEAAEALRRQKVRQAEEKIAAVAWWQENGLVFPSSIGTPMNRHNLFRRYFKPLLKKAGLPDIVFHDLRHTFATIMLFETSEKMPSTHFGA
jgi:integrase